MGLVGVEDRGAVRHVALRRVEKRNALNDEMVQALGSALEEAAAESQVRCVVVRGEGPMFSSGMDVGSLAELAAHPENLRSFRSEILRVWNLLEEMPKPTIAEIHGGCIGGALELALACDLRVMAEDAVTGLVETRVGLLPDVGGCSRLPAIVGVGIAKELILTGRLIDGSEAYRIGLANRVAPADELEATTASLCEELVAAAPLAVSLAKRVIDAAAKPDFAVSLEREVTAQAELAASEDFAEGTRAFAERRQPEFAGH
jgi:enoyl-CoA hydratase/carnithine racemase